VVKELVPQHLVLEHVIDVLEVFLQILKRPLIVPDLGICKVVVIKHHSFHWEAQVNHYSAQLLLVVHEHVLDDVLVVVLVVNGNVHHLLPENVVLCLFHRLLNFQAFYGKVAVVLNDWLDVVYSFRHEP